MEGGFLLNVVIGEGPAILELLPGKDEPLLVWGDPLLVLDLGLDVLDGIGRLNLESDGLAGQGLNEDLHTTAETQDEMQSGFLLNVVIRKGSAIFQLLSSEDQPLLVGRNALLVLDFSLDVLDGVGGFNLKSDGLAGQSLDENLHSTTETQDEMQSGFLLNVVIREGSAIFQLLSSEDQPLLVRWNSLLVLDLGLDVFNRVRGLDLESDGLASQGLDEDLHSTTKSENEVEGGLLLNVVIGEGSAIFQLLSSEDEPLLIRGDSLLVLDLGLDVLDGVRGLDLKGDSLPGKGFDEDLHSSTETQNKMEGALLLDVVVREGPTVLELLASEDQPLLVRGDALLVLDLSLDILDGIRGLDLEGNSLPGEGLDENLHFQRFFV